MDVIEKAIRGALEKGDAEDKAFREKVYRSAFAALDKALQANTSVTVETAIVRRKALQAKITEIESEYIPAVPAIDPASVSLSPAAATPSVELDTPPVQRVQPATTTAAATRTEPSFDGAPAAAPQPAVSVEGDRTTAFTDSDARALHVDRVAPRAESGFAADPDLSPQRERRRRPFATLFALITLVALIGAGGWWAHDTGLFKTFAERDTSVPNPPKSIESEDFDADEEPVRAPLKPGETEPAGKWISVFSPADASSVSAPAGTSAEVVASDAGQVLRISSGDGAAVLFDVGQGVLEQIAGKRAVFVIVARAEEGQETQISVTCNFGELGDCGRKRYAVGYARSEFLFEVELPAKRPGAGGTIAIGSDIGTGGKAVDIFEIKVSAGD
ncbi:hypothetical protein GA830_08140 [Mesorhizobium sp. NBSH29]|uniref:hypothetical protein n=1 Tax=Mesorhizobium sp. NBSH29 TaxID=2654249 RepID=UPI00189679DC|nr:hypothetical protein [Mesorhizobium sp. NBSH29]QPC86708.1 hypothetical protein GA830_08140 [Mesorhizobium sp. NBSH29]